MLEVDNAILAALGEPPLELKRMVTWYLNLYNALCELVPLPALTLPVDCIGMIFECGHAVAQIPSGFLLCYGQELNRVGAYAPLFAKIGTQWGVGNGTTTFNIPDTRDRVLIGLSNMGGTDANVITSVVTNAVGTTGGGDQVTLDASKTPNHTPVLKHNGNSEVNTFSSFGTWATNNAVNLFVPGYPNATRTAHDITTEGSGTPLDLINPFIVQHGMIYSGV